MNVTLVPVQPDDAHITFPGFALIDTLTAEDAFTIKFAETDIELLVLQFELVNAMAVILTEFAPELFNVGVVNVPPAPLLVTVMVAVVDDTVFVPLTL